MSEQDFITNCLWALNETHPDDRSVVLETISRFNKQRAHYRATMLAAKKDKLEKQFDDVLKRVEFQLWVGADIIGNNSMADLFLIIGIGAYCTIVGILAIFWFAGLVNISKRKDNDYFTEQNY